MEISQKPLTCNNLTLSLCDHVSMCHCDPEFYNL